MLKKKKNASNVRLNYCEIHTDARIAVYRGTATVDNKWKKKIKFFSNVKIK